VKTWILVHVHYRNMEVVVTHTILHTLTSSPNPVFLHIQGFLKEMYLLY